jgi:hypothetical protein
VRAPQLDTEAAKAAQLYTATGHEFPRNRLKHHADEGVGIAIGDSRVTNKQLIDNIALGHLVARYGCRLSLTTSSAAAAATLFAVEPQLFVEDILKREACALALTFEIGLHLLAFFMLAQGLD